MSKASAHKRLLIGYMIAIIGFIAGASSDFFHPNPVFAFFFAGYLFWSTYLGWFIMYRPMQDLFANMIVFQQGLYSLFIVYIAKQLLVLWLTLIFAMMVGGCGGAIYMQIKWSKIAYT